MKETANLFGGFIFYCYLCNRNNNTQNTKVMNKFRYVLYNEDGTSEILFESKEFKFYMDVVREYKRVLLELAKKYDVKDYNNPIELQFFKEEDGNWYFHSTAIDILLYEIEKN